MSTTTSKSALIIGATGLTGMAIIDKLSSHDNKPNIHVMARSPQKLANDARLNSVIKGDAKSKLDIEKAVKASRPDWLVLCVGNGADTAKSDTRAANAAAVVAVLQKPEFRNIKVIAVSSHGAGPTELNIGFGLGKIISFHLRHVFADHTQQELTLQNALNQKRLTIVRPTTLTVDKAKGELVTFGNKEKCPTIETDRADLAAWIANEISGLCPLLPNGGAVSVTGVKN